MAFEMFVKLTNAQFLWRRLFSHSMQRKGEKVRYSLLLEKVYELDVAVLAEVPLKPLIVELVKVLDIADIDVARGAGVDSKGESGSERTRVLAPPDL